MTTPEYPQQPQYPQPAVVTPPQKKGLSGGAIFGIVAGVIVLVACAACGIGVLVIGSDSDKDGKPGNDGTVVTYQVDGSGTASITYNADGQASTEQVNDATLPWNKDVTIKATIGSLSVIAQRQADDGGEITCRILKDGKEIEKHTSSGPFAVVTCSDSL